VDSTRETTPERAATAPDSRASVLQPIPRRQKIIATTAASSSLPGIRSMKFKAGTLRSLGRLARWLSVIAYVVGGNLWDRLLRRDGPGRRAVRLRLGLQKAGGTFVKFGQQLAMRIDLLPWDYCVELSKLLDRMPAFPLEEALAAFARTTGKPWHEVFAVFDPEPVGSASIACVYQATLKDGTKVAVKIRRPGIGAVFMADFKVLDWLLGLVEFLTIVRPGFTRGLRRELRETLLEELDFRKEAQCQDIFRRNAREKARKRFFSAPHVHFDLSSDEVLVQEFVSGMWLWEIIAAIEQNDPQGLAMMRQLDIDPPTLARRILWVAFWSMDEHVFFHADPHPANIVVGPGNTVTFIDFGSCGSFDDEQRRAFEQIVVSMRKGDTEGMARATLKLLEPFAPIDVSGLMKFMEAEYIRVLLTFRTKAKYTEWWERTSARLWLAMVKAARHYSLPMNLQMLKMLRATLLYDTLVLRLDGSVNRYEEYARFRRKDRARWAAERWRKRARDTRRDLFLRVEELAEAGEDLMARAQQTISSPVLSFRSVIEKWVFTFSVLSRTVGRLVVITGIAVAMVVIARYVRSEPALTLDSLWTALRNRAYQVVVLAAIVLNTRDILFRLTERDVKFRDARR
jgi:predicted unusual protein kinase regulating ubiquinone biosynthesis (AarF/ABC1/UbiB family)